MEEKRNSAVPVALAVALVLVPLVAYVAGYFLLGRPEISSMNGAPVKIRQFPSETIAHMYDPLATLEAAITGIRVWISWPDGTGTDRDVLP